MRERETLIEDDEFPVRLGWLEYGDPSSSRTVLCVHGLTRNAHDFDMLAQALSTKARVIALDVAGRGRSSWLDDKSGYDVPIYARHILGFLERERLGPVDWIGTSMGGLIAMAVAGLGQHPFRSLVLNDIGPFVPKKALEMIRDYLGLDLSFPSIDAVEQHLRFIHASFGPLTDEQWHHLAVHSARADGAVFRLHYDPEIRQPFAEAAMADIDVWSQYDSIRCPALLLRGADSVLLLEDTAREMAGRGPRVDIATFAGVGHAPALMADDQIACIRRFLDL
ncbi:MAG: alpha/beta hydrolase [Geminicoccaceae bacterium]